MRQINSIGAAAKSVAVLVVFAITAYGAGYALGDNEPRLSDMHSDMHDAPELIPLQTPNVGLLDDDGAEIYMTRCMSCHQMNGRGVSGVFPPLVSTEWVTGDKGRLIRVVLNGLTGEIDVEGETYSGAMPPWRSFLDDDQTAALLTYIRQAWGNDASEVTPAEVASVRTVTEERRDPWTQEELLQEENQGIPGTDSDSAAGAADDQESSGSSSKDGSQ